ncbi:MAG: hypothetical protein N3D18_08815 [Roseococcus sp.]|nr:hypothetical protein [Roseococcus sp.]
MPGRRRDEGVELLCRELAVPVLTLAQWREKADAALEGALKAREAVPPASSSSTPP